MHSLNLELEGKNRELENLREKERVKIISTIFWKVYPTVWWWAG
jgi:hypothetical protein